MSKETGIAWADHTFNPWIGCAKVSAGCDHCYAARYGKRYHVPWTADGARRVTASSTWRQVAGWNAAARKAGVRRRVFPSLCDIFDTAAPRQTREAFWSLVARTPDLDWLLLTKRPQNVMKLLPENWGTGWPNVWLGVSAEDQAAADLRIPHLLLLPAKVRFVSIEPMIGPVQLRWVRNTGTEVTDALVGHVVSTQFTVNSPVIVPKLDWVILGGETGPGARRMEMAWARSVAYDCSTAGVPFFFKQWGDAWKDAVQDVLDNAKWQQIPTGKA